MLSLDGIARALGGEVRGNKVRAPGPGHSPADRSLTVWLTDDGSDITVDSFANDGKLLCKDYARSKIGLPPWEPKSANDDSSIKRMSARVRKDSAQAAKPEPADEPVAETIVLPIPAEKRPGHFRS
ncbi:hypothetical protein GUJ75_25440, partial|uniref:hypothetical protein n=1 Tax=Escherichia coli TaxID=562 RepID=UPI00168E56C3